MKKLMRVSVLVICLFCFIALFIPLAAQQNGGGTIAYGFTTNEQYGSPMLCGWRNCWVISGAMNVDLLGIDPETGWFAPNQQKALVANWEFSDGNRVLTLYLRDDLSWSDGTPITAADVMMSYDLALHPETSIQGVSGISGINSTIEKIEVLDEHTLRIIFIQGNCTALLDTAAYLYVLPAHIYRQLIEEVGYAGLWTHEWFQHPTVVSGPFRFGEVSADNSVTLLRNENFPGTVVPERFKQVNIETLNMTLETFLSSEANVISFIENEHTQDFVDAAHAGLLQIYQYPENRVIFLAFNLADPNNPQPALDENGRHINQGLHPIFGDKLTRQAIARAIDVDSLIEETQNGFATRLSTHIIPNSWAFNSDLLPIPYDLQLALALLAEAGWIPENPDLPASSENRLICQNCRYAREVDSEFNGSYLEFEMPRIQVEGVNRQIDMIAEQLRLIGIRINLYDTSGGESVERAIAQTFDATLFGLNGGYPYDPASNSYLGPLNDIPGSGFNVTSFYSEAYFALEATANSVPGCGLTERANIYRQMQEIIYEEQPFVFFYANTGTYVAKNEVEGFAPYPNNLFWNMDTWVVHENE